MNQALTHLIRKVFPNFRRISVSETGVWLNAKRDAHMCDKLLAAQIVSLCHEKKWNKVIDLGCGPGDYVKYLRSHNISSTGVDGNPNTASFCSGCQVADLTQPFPFAEDYDCVLSLEVGEHIPEKYEKTFLDTLCQSKKGIILSWYPNKDEEGDGHVNQRSNEYVSKQIEGRGFKRLVKEGDALRKSCKVWWFKESLMVFERS